MQKVGLVWWAFMALCLVSCDREISIGLSVPMSGSDASWGASLRQGAELAVEIVNRSQPFPGLTDLRVPGYPYVLNSEDHRGLPHEAPTSIYRLIDRSSAVAIIGGSSSSMAMIESRVAARNGCALVTGVASSPHVPNVNDHTFQVGLNDNIQGRHMARFVKNVLLKNHVGVLTNQTLTYSMGLSEAFKREFIALGGRITEEFYQSDTGQFSAQVINILARNVDAFFLSGVYLEVPLIGREIRSRGFGGPITGGDGWGASALHQNDQDNLVGSYFSDFYAADPEFAQTDPAMGRFNALFTSRYGTAPDAAASGGFNAAIFTMVAIKRAYDQARTQFVFAPSLFDSNTQLQVNRAVREAIVREMQNIRTYPSTNGMTRMNLRTVDAGLKLYIKQVEANGFRTAYSAEEASGIRPRPNLR